MSGALTSRMHKGTDSDGNFVVPSVTATRPEPEVWQQQGSKLQPMGTMRRGNGNVTGGVPFVAHALTAEGSDASEDGTGRGTPLVVAPTLTASMGTNNAAPGNGGKDEMVVPVDLAQVTSGENRSNPRAADPAGTLAATSRPAVAFGHTNGLDVQASEVVTPTLRAGHGVGGGSVAAAAAVRRLTPVECERLQGFPDGWTAKRVDLALADNRWEPTERGTVEQADSGRYRQLGNSIAGPVFAWVAEGIVMVGDTGPDAFRINVE